MADAAGDKCNIKLNSKIISLDTNFENGKVVAVTENGETIKADNVVIACGGWTNHVWSEFGLGILGGTQKGDSVSGSPTGQIRPFTITFTHFQTNSAFAPQ